MLTTIVELTIAGIHTEVNGTRMQVKLVRDEGRLVPRDIEQTMLNQTWMWSQVTEIRRVDLVGSVLLWLEFVRAHNCSAQLHLSLNFLKFFDVFKGPQKTKFTLKFFKNYYFHSSAFKKT